jgi:DegV family protein with EDD domain
VHIVSDSGMDMYLPPELLPDAGITIVPHSISLDRKTYRSGVDIQPAELYAQLMKSAAFPTTSQPSPGDFGDVFRRLAASDPDILYVAMSSGLSGTANAARLGAALAPLANVTVVDSKTLSGPLGWQVAAAARAAQVGWRTADIVALLHRIAAATDCIYTLDDLKYLIHGGRISHMKGLLASVLHIRPMIGVTKTTGVYEQLGQARTLDAAVRGLVDIIARKHAPGTALRAQIMHGANPHAAALLHERIDKLFSCTWMPLGAVSPVLGAHTGPSLVGVGFAALAEYPAVP